jgi:hypothetical protein
MSELFTTPEQGAFRNATPKAETEPDVLRDHQCDQAMLVRKELQMR